MRIKMRTTAAGPQGVYRAGKVIEVAEELGRSFVEGRSAEVVSAPGRLARMVAAASEEPEDPGTEDSQESEDPRKGSKRKG